MKTIVKRVIRDERGNVLSLVLILLVVGGLILTPLLGLMSTGLMAGQVYERHTHRLYAADAGVEDAIWKIKYDPPETYPYHYLEPLVVGGKTVDVTIYRYDWDPTCGENLTYRILSTVITDDGGGTAAVVNSTVIDAHLVASYMDLSNLLDNAIISDTYIGIKNGVYVTGNVTSGGEVQCFGDDCEDVVDGTVTEHADLDWPTGDEFSGYYLPQVGNATTYYGDTLIDLEGNSCPPGPIYINDMENGDWPDGLGPLCVNGTLDITSSDTQEVVTLNLTDTLYITGDTKIYGPNADEPYKLNIHLNGQTIFVESSTAGAKYALEVKDCTISGSGCIIAVGDVYFAPKGVVGSEHDFVLIMSVEGTTLLQPSGAFYGCIAGDLSVDVQSGHNATITHTAPDGIGLNIPWGPGNMDDLPPITGLTIKSWEIS